MCTSRVYCSARMRSAARHGTAAGVPAAATSPRGSCAPTLGAAVRCHPSHPTPPGKPCPGATARPSPAPSPPATSPCLLPTPPAAPCHRRRVPLSTFPTHHRQRRHPFLAHGSRPTAPRSPGTPCPTHHGAAGPQPTTLISADKGSARAMCRVCPRTGEKWAAPRCHAGGMPLPRGPVFIPIRVPTGVASQRPFCPAPALRYG